LEEVKMLTSRLIAAAALIPLAVAASAQGKMDMPIVAIDLKSYSYSPSPIHLTAGQPVMLQFVNRAGKSHDFTAPAFFASARILAGEVQGGEVDVAAGRAKAVKLVPAAGTYKVHCSHPFHKMLGMKSTIIVR
jgi:plastocyanin